MWSLRAQGRNALLTGDIGSGKSTLVDALTTLLVAPGRVAYNKAGRCRGARERTLRSYVLGYYKSARHELSGSGRPVALREANSYSVILGVFHNAGYDQTVTLAQVFWHKDAHGAAGPFLRHCRPRPHDRRRLRRLRHRRAPVAQAPARGRRRDRRQLSAVRRRAFRRRFGIGGEQALDLFHQTVSMKSVGNLTDFVRSHMLEAFDVAPRLQALISHFEDLRRAHEAVQKAKRQVERLAPLVADCSRHDEIAAETEQLRACREALRNYFAERKAELLAERLARLGEELLRQAGHIARLDAKRAAQRAQERELRQAMADNGGDRIERLGAEIERHENEKKKRFAKAERYDELRRSLGLLAVQGADDFLAQRRACGQMRDAADEREAAVQNQLNEAGVAFADGRREHEVLASEIASLKARRSNIDAQQIRVREALCSALGLAEAEMPFAGELIQVRDDERDWEGAAERLLHNFGLSLLVPDKHYTVVSEWVDRTHLKGRLVYFRVRPARREPGDIGKPQHPDSLARKLAVKPDSAFYGWLERELVQRFDYACATNAEQFRRETRTVTRAGQIKAPGERHEKDDRHRLDDRSRYVLGWSNEAKVAALEARSRVLESQLHEIGARIATLQKEQGAARDVLQALGKLDEYRDFSEIDWRPLAAEIARLEQERRTLEAASDKLKALAGELDTVLAALALNETALDGHKKEEAKAEQKKSDAKAALDQANALLAVPAHEAHAAHFERIERLRAEALGEHTLNVEGCDAREQELRKWLQDRIDAEDKKLARLGEKIVAAMAEYKESFKLDARDVDASVAAAADYRAMLAQLNADDLPRFEARFKELLNENTIRDVANFQSQLNRERETIRERIARINESLTRIDYNDGRYIVLEAQATSDAEIRDFQTELRACTEGSLTGSESAEYSEAKFLQVKSVIERFRGREGSAEHDRRWAAKVCDVRNWFTFAASERWREDESEFEHYADSGGKSGGQKEKLAYTILAASLAYQFGLEWGELRSRTFRFAVIDEAFGRGSDESAQYGLKLFQQLNLQLLVVTPLQKIHIIEPFVSSVGFVHNEDGSSSRLRNLSIEEYRAERDAHRSADPA